MRKKPNPYYFTKSHPLTKVPQEIIDAARHEMAGAVEWKDVHPDIANPLADAIVMSLLPWLKIDYDN